MSISSLSFDIELRVVHQHDMATVMNMKLTGLTLGFFEIFRTLTGEERDAIARKMSCKQYEAGEYVIPSPTDDRHVYFLVSGLVKACAYNHSGKQVYFQDLTPGMMFGELAAIDNGERTSDCICTETSVVASLGRQRFLEMLDDHPSAKSQVLNRLVSMVRVQLQRVYEYTSYSVNQRVRFELLRLIADAGDDEPPIRLESVPTQADIADRISSHREAVSRELKALDSEGLITWKRGEHVIHDPARLMQRARLS
ncbi:MAG: Crp/Fnr family transcriptional regulator [Granulosicoccus sp.]